MRPAASCEAPVSPCPPGPGGSAGESPGRPAGTSRTLLRFERARHGGRATSERSPSGARMIASGSRPRAADAESSFDHRLHPSFRCEASIDGGQRENGAETRVQPSNAERTPSRHPRGVSAGRARAAEHLPAPGAGLPCRRVFPSDRVRGRLRAPSSSPPRFGTVSRSDRRVVEEKCARARPRLSAPPS
jgi:hypothetical protein